HPLLRHVDRVRGPCRELCPYGPRPARRDGHVRGRLVKPPYLAASFISNVTSCAPRRTEDDRRRVTRFDAVALTASVTFALEATALKTASLYQFICDSALRIGQLEICRTPCTGRSISRTTKIAAPITT